MTYDVIILGGGAAGLFSAVTAAARGRSVVVIEKAERIGKKILISGGGRCNFTNTGATHANYISSSPHFCKSALAGFQPQDFIRRVEQRGIGYHEKKLGQLFCDQSSKLIVDLLEQECREQGVELRTQCDVFQVEKPEKFRVTTSAGVLESISLVVATGGLSFPKLGATDFGYRLARQFGLDVIDPRPGLVPLTIGGTEVASLAGVSVDTIISGINTPKFRENILFTHRGLSGPAILQISSYLPPGQMMQIDLLPDRPGFSWVEAERTSRKALSQQLSTLLPRRFVEWWLPRELADRPVQSFTNSELLVLTRNLHVWEVPITGTEGYAKAEVTIGGVDTRQLSSKTMECRSVSGLFFIGEVVDVTGWLGGYNFQWAWASAFAAGRAI